MLTPDSFFSYVDDRAKKNRHNALIHAEKAQNIRTILIDPKNREVESAHFR